MKIIFISQLPERIQAYILSNLRKLMEEQHYTELEIQESCKAVLDEKVNNMFDIDGSFIC